MTWRDILKHRYDCVSYIVENDNVCAAPANIGIALALTPNSPSLILASESGKRFALDNFYTAQHVSEPVMPAHRRLKKHGTALFAAIILNASGVISSMPPLAAQDKTPGVTLILDSSRSMWGQIDGINKVVSARTVIGELAKNYEGRLQIGLVSYGHRQSSGCKDIEAIVPLGTHKASTVIKAVNGIKPKGSTPIAASLELAAQSAGYKERKTTLLLLSDGLDNCSGDPCAMAEKLKSQSPSISIHVIAFDRKTRKKLTKLSCIAKVTGGSFHSTTSESELSAAVTKIAELVIAPPLPKVTQMQPSAAPATQPQARQALPAPAQMQPPAAPRSPAPFPQTKKMARGEPAVPAQQGAPVPVSFSAKLVEDGDVVKSGIVWRIFNPRPDKDGKYKLIATHRNAMPADALPPGEYLVNAAYGLAHTSKRIQVQAGQSLQENFVLNAGGLRLGAVLTDGTAIPPNSVRYDIFADEADQFGKRKEILADAEPGLVIRLNAGAYHIISKYGDANAIVHADITVEPGRLTEATMNHTAAKVTFKLVLQPGGEALANTQWNILTPRGDVVKESAGALPTHVLAVGTYTVLAKHEGKNYTRNFDVQPGEASQIEVVIR